MRQEAEPQHKQALYRPLQKRTEITPPLCLTIPGLNNSGPRHWQTLWEEARPDCRRVDLGTWSNPHRSHWVTKLDLAIRDVDAPVILVAHSLGCLTVAWWLALSGKDIPSNVRGAFLVAPPDVERVDFANVHTADLIARFAPAPHVRFPFPAVLVASRNDRLATIERAAEFAARWGCDFVDVGHLGHINADSFLDAWEEGQRILDGLIVRAADPK